MNFSRLSLPLSWFLFVLFFLTQPISGQVTYTVDREFNFSFPASLTGTVEIPEGTYTIMNQGPSPFTSVDLTLTVDGTPYALSMAFTGMIKGTGQFLINATSTTLTFNTLNADGANWADLQFFTDNIFSGIRYVTGHDGAPWDFETVSTPTGAESGPTTLPMIFGTSVPEPSTCLGVSVTLGLFALLRGRIGRRTITS
jgi:hypothetical protein